MSYPRLTFPTAIVLGCVAHGHSHGFDIIDLSGLPSGTVYPILRRLESAGLLRSRWEAVARARAENRPPRRLYQVTAAGATELARAFERYPGLARLLEPRAGEGAPSPA
jgi:DNA-binding PadR family transcriptional regulator